MNAKQQDLSVVKRMLSLHLRKITGADRVEIDTIEQMWKLGEPSTPVYVVSGSLGFCKSAVVCLKFSWEDYWPHTEEECKIIEDYFGPKRLANNTTVTTDWKLTKI